MYSFKLKDPGEGIHEAEILEVKVSRGDEVSEGDVVLVIETDKAAVEVPAPCSGSIDQVAVSEGDVVEVGAELMRIDDGEASAAEGPSSSNRKRSPQGSETSSRDEAVTDEDGAGADRRMREDDKAREDKVLASPAARRLAREREVDLTAIDGTGPDGRVLVEDVRQSPSPKGGTGQHEAAGEPDERRIPFRSVRRATARAMERAWEEIPHVTHTVHVDITALSAFRTARKGDFPYLTLTVLVLKALSAALRRHPRFNARLEDDEIVLMRRHHFGVAVDTDRGLLVPVLKDVDHQSMRELSTQVEELVNRARGGTLQAEEMKGGTFTLTNVGASGATHFTPIINPPQAAILGVAQADLYPVARDGTSGEVHWEARRLLPLILAFDHRLNDGMDAARFMSTLSSALEGPEELLAAL